MTEELLISWDSLSDGFEEISAEESFEDNGIDGNEVKTTQEVNIEVMFDMNEQIVYEELNQLRAEKQELLRRIATIDESNKSVTKMFNELKVEKNQNDLRMAFIEKDNKRQMETIEELQNKTFSDIYRFYALYNTRNKLYKKCKECVVSTSSNKTEEQILSDCETLMDNVDLLRPALREMFRYFQLKPKIANINRIFNIVLRLMSRLSGHEDIQRTSSALLFRITITDELKQSSDYIKLEFIGKILDIMNANKNDKIILRNGILSLITFKIPKHFTEEYLRFIQILLHILTVDEDLTIQLIVLNSLKDLIANETVDNRKSAGDLGVIERMVALIEIQLKSNKCQTVVEIAVDVILRTTVHLPSNTERLVDCKGIYYVFGCIESYSENIDLLRKLTVIVMNTAVDSPHLRHHFMKEEYIKKMVELLDSEATVFGISYSTAYTLAILASVGQAFWEKYLPIGCKREQMLSRLKIAMNGWKLNSNAFIFFTELTGFASLLRPNIPPECQYFAAWSLAHFTRFDCSKYCPLLHYRTNCVIVLKSLLNDESIDSNVRHMSSLTLYQYMKYKTKGNLNELKNSEDIAIPLDFNIDNV